MANKKKNKSNKVPLTPELSQKIIQEVNKDVQKAVQKQKAKPSKANPKRMEQIQNSVAMGGEIGAALLLARKEISAEAMFIAKTIADPNTFLPVRNGMAGSSFPTAVASEWNALETDWGAISSPDLTHYPPPGQQVMCLFFDALRGYAIYCVNSDAAVWIYNWYFPRTSGGPAASMSINVTDTNIDLITAYSKSDVTADWAPYGAIQPNGLSKEGKRYLWVDNGSITITAATAMASGKSAKYRLYEWVSDSEALAFETTMASSTTTATFTIQHPGLYRVMFVSSDDATTPVVLTVKSGGNGQVWQQGAFNDWAENPALYTDFANLSGSILFKNTTPDQYIGGQLWQARGMPEQYWLSYAAGGVNSVTKIQGAKEFKAKEGGYCFLKSKDNTDLNFQNSVKVVDGVLMMTGYGIEAEAPWQIMAMKAPSAVVDGVSISTYQETTAIVTKGIEGVSTTKFLAYALPRMNEEAYKEALVLLRNVENMTKNGTHIRDIGRWILGAAASTGKFVMKHGKFAIDTGMHIYNGYQAGGYGGAAAAAIGEVPAVISQFSSGG